jgi:hypothetical protein
LAQTECRVKIARLLTPVSHAPGRAAIAGASDAKGTPLQRGGALTIRRSLPARVVNTLLRLSPCPEAAPELMTNFRGINSPVALATCGMFLVPEPFGACLLLAAAIWWLWRKAGCPCRTMLSSFWEGVRRGLHLPGAHYSAGGVDGGNQPASNLARGNSDSDRTAGAFATTPVAECPPPAG